MLIYRPLALELSIKVSNKVEQSSNKNILSLPLIFKVLTCRQVIKYFQVNGSFCSVFVLTKAMATVASSVIFRNVKNREDVLYLAVASCFLLDHFVFLTPFPGHLVVI